MGSEKKASENQPDANKKQKSRDQSLNEITGGSHRRSSPRSAFKKMTEYVPTRVRASALN